MWGREEPQKNQEAEINLSMLRSTLSELSVNTRHTTD